MNYKKSLGWLLVRVEDFIEFLLMAYFNYKLRPYFKIKANADSEDITANYR